MAIAFRSAAAATASGVTSVSVTKPAGVVNGDFLVAFHSRGSSGTGTGGADLILPASFTDQGVGGLDLATGNVRCGTRTASGEPASYTFTKNTFSFNSISAVLAFQNEDPTNPIDVFPIFEFNNTVDVNHTSSGLTTNFAADIMVIAFFSNSAGGVAGSYTPPAGMTEQTDNQQGTTSFMSTDTETIASPGATGPRTAVISTAAQKCVVVTLALNGVRPVVAVTQFEIQSRAALINGYTI